MGKVISELFVEIRNFEVRWEGLCVGHEMELASSDPSHAPTGIKLQFVPLQGYNVLAPSTREPQPAAGPGLWIHGQGLVTRLHDAPIAIVIRAMYLLPQMQKVLETRLAVTLEQAQDALDAAL